MRFVLFPFTAGRVGTPAPCILHRSSSTIHPPAIPRPVLRPALLTLVLASLGCASAGQSWRAGPAGIPAEAQLRSQMVAGQFGSALESLKDKRIAPADALLRHLYKGLVAVHAGQHELGTRALDRAWQISHDRYTRRLGDAAATMVTGEGALPYNVGPAERMLIPYYAGLNWLARNEYDDVAVEARRLGVLLESDASNNPSARFQGAMRYIAGVLFEVAGERNDAGVAYRNAAALLEQPLPVDTVPPDSAHGDVVVFLEDGFVARPEPAQLDFWVRTDEVALLTNEDSLVRMEAYDVIVRRRGANNQWGADRYRNVSLRWPRMVDGSGVPAFGQLGARATPVPAAVFGAFDDPTMPGTEIPVLDRTATAGMNGAGEGGANDGLAPAPTLANVISASVSDAVRADFDREQPARLARALARAAVREASIKGADGAFNAAGDILDDDDDDSSSKGKGKKGSDKDDKDDDSGAGKGLAAAGMILLGIGLLVAHASSQVLDQPDLRAWQLLPDRVSIARMRLPVGEHVVEVTRDGEAYSLGTVTVRPGSVNVLVHRWWPERRPLVASSEPRVP